MIAGVFFIGIFTVRETFGKEDVGSLRSVTCDCGWKNDVQSKLNIIGGKTVVDYEYPFVAGLIPVDGPEAEPSCGDIHCGATILSDWHLVTAAHCTSPGQDYAIAAAASFLQTCILGGAQIRHVAKVTVHPDYNDETLENDIALLTLSSRLLFTDKKVGPVCLPVQGETHPLQPGDSVTVMGWGVTETEPEGSENLNAASLSVMDYDECLTYFNNSDLRPWDEHSQLCTYQIGEGVCKGDSGGPVLSRNPTSGLYFLRGLISFAPDTCSTRMPSVHTRISAYVPWLIREAGEAFCQEV